MLFKKFMTAIFAISALAGQAQEKQFDIIPEPVEITAAGEGTVLIERDMLVRVSDSSQSHRLIFLPVIQTVI